MRLLEAIDLLSPGNNYRLISSISSVVIVVLFTSSPCGLLLNRPSSLRPLLSAVEGAWPRVGGVCHSDRLSSAAFSLTHFPIFRVFFSFSRQSFKYRLEPFEEVFHMKSLASTFKILIFFLILGEVY